MKTKFSLLALPLYAGVALVFALGACGGDKGNGPKDKDSSSSSYVPPDGTKDENIELKNFKITKAADGKLIISGTFSASGDAIANLKFDLPNLSWISYKGQAIPSNGIITTGLGKNVSLSEMDNATEINLKNTSIPCGKHSIIITACSDEARTKCTNNAAKDYDFETEFEKPADYCATSSSDGGDVSSSSGTPWVFDIEKTLTIQKNTEQQISGNVKFKIIDEESCGAAGLKIEMTGTSMQIKLFHGLTRDFVPEKDKEYDDDKYNDLVDVPDRCIESGEPYLISSGSEKYLIKIPLPWPLNAKYWKVTKSP